MIAYAFDTYTDVVVGICAVLSPHIRWDRNLLETHMLLDGEFDGYTAYGTNVAKAWALKAGDLAPDEIRGPKVKAFATLLLNPKAHTVCIDTWAIRIALGMEQYTDVKGYTSIPRINLIKQAYAGAAILLEERPSHVQAATWLHKRGE